MAKPDSKLKRDGKGYMLTITHESGPDTRIKIGENGQMRNLSGSSITQVNVTLAVLHFRTIGASGMVEAVIGWWEKR